ncbi:PilZ domain-containing protein [Pseudomonas sp. ok272]|uniref:PilZ domain-containing protein n=1 Tax=unclassified Pseudomonas TaxID=196821 RepID=UPI0008BDB52E|nr:MULTISPECIES: PilZ domain-containing protein [unclassified Pseudomonas]SEM63454.1 PilZ domain-containing protein [Pseudomonas sp. ok272]SFM46494.1 PilZ domain-containing protein [Pseudomonas sp. ok602]
MRQHTRITFRSIFRIKVSDCQTDQLIGYVGDVSESGLRLLSDAPQDVDSCMNLRLRMRDRDGELRKVDILALCLWSQENARTGYFESGFRLAQDSEAFAHLVGNMRPMRRVQS